MWSMNIMADLPVSGNVECLEHSNKVLHCRLQGFETCIRVCNRQQKALPLVLTINSYKLCYALTPYRHPALQKLRGS